VTGAGFAEFKRVFQKFYAVAHLAVPIIYYRLLLAASLNSKQGSSCMTQGEVRRLWLVIGFLVLAGTLLAALMYFNPDGSRKSTPATIQNPHR
jgi:hypothetical protein